MGRKKKKNTGTVFSLSLLLFLLLAILIDSLMFDELHLMASSGIAFIAALIFSYAFPKLRPSKK